jgi:Ca-activated chloride channel family protein
MVINLKKRLISFLLASSMLFITASADYDTAVNALIEQNILQGDENGDLNLSAPVTRAEFVKMILEALGIEKASDGKNTFTDLTPDHWSYDYISTASSLGLINGFEDKTVRPDDNVTYEQAVKMAVQAVNAEIFEYPQGYIGFALDNMFLDNVQSHISEYMTRLDTANLIYNVSVYAKSNGIQNNIISNESTLGAASNDSTTNYVQDSESATSGGSGGGGSASSGSSSSAILGGSLSVYPYINPYYNTEEYDAQDENIFKTTALSPLSTFSIDTDTASYSNMRRYIISGQIPPKGSIRSEELINYFDYDLPLPEDSTPFSVTTEVAACPWNDLNKIAMINIKGDEIPKSERQAQNLVFLIDVSGSMYSQNKLPLIKKSMSILLDNLDERDTISIVTYASGTNVILSGANASERDRIMNCINSLHAGGSTNGESGLQLAYEQAEEFKTDGNNRIILCTDGDFNVGITSDADLKNIVSEKRESGIYLSVLGFGMGNYKDSKLEIMADNGNGNYYYIDSLREAKKVLADEMTKTLYTIAKDVKIQVEFNPATVKEYRLIGYENRILNAEDFNNDKKDAGEIGAGACVTALYEIVPEENGEAVTGDDSLRYQTSTYSQSGELMDVKIRYKLPDSDESVLNEYPVENTVSESMSKNLSFASAAAELGMILNRSEYMGTSTYDSVMELAKNGKDEDEYGLKAEFIQLVDLLRYIDRYNSPNDDKINY